MAGWISARGATDPSVLTQPINQLVIAGGTATFSVVAGGTGPFTYQWQFNGTNLPNGVITTVAGNGTGSFSGDGGAATNAAFYGPASLAVDASGNLFIADQNNNRVRKVGANGIITTVAGNGTYGYSGDGGAANSAALHQPTGAAVDAFGNLFISDRLNNCVREVGTNGIITTVAGKGTAGYSGDGGAATNAALYNPDSVAVDASGNLFIADQNNNRVRKVGANGIITTVVGNGTAGYSGDGGAATNAELSSQQEVMVDSSGNLFIADYDNFRIRAVGTNGIITTVAGNGTLGYSGDGGWATNAALCYPAGVAEDASGNLFIADYGNFRIREVGTNGIITTVAGNGMAGYSGDGGAATNAALYGPAGVVVDASGNLFIADFSNNRVRKVFVGGPMLALNNVGASSAGAYDVVISNSLGSVTSSVATLTVLLPPTLGTQPLSQSVVVGSNAAFSVAATGTAPLGYQWYFNGAPLPDQTNTALLVSGVAFTNAGAYEVVVTNLYGSVTSAVAVLSVEIPPGIAAQPGSQTNVLNSTATFSVTATGTGPFAYQWQFNGTNLPGVIATVAGNGMAGYSGDGGAATNAKLNSPGGVAVDAFGDMFIGDLGNNRIREVGTNGIITTVAGNGTQGYAGDGGAATNAKLSTAGVVVDGVAVDGVAVDALGNLFITDQVNNRIRKVGTNGIITTVAGNGTAGYSGDWGAATNAKLNYPSGVAVDAFGNLFIADNYNHRVREVGTNGIITTVAGNGTYGYSGDGGWATSAALHYADGVAVDASGNLFIADYDNRIRRVGTNGIITTVAGNGTAGYSGDGAAATNTKLNSPGGVAVDAFGNLFIGDQSNNRIRSVVFGGPTLVLNHVAGTSAGAYDVVVSSPYGSVTSSVVTLTVLVPPPASFSLNPASGPAPLTVTFTNTTGGSYTNAVWTYGDGTRETNLNATVTHTFSNPLATALTNTVVLKMTDSALNQSSATNTVVVWPVPVPSFTLSANSVGTSVPVYFTNMTAPGTFASVLWSFGDNTYDPSTNWVSHAYSSAGSEMVTLRVTNAYGVAASATNSLTVTNTAPGVVVGTPSITSFYVQGGTNVIIMGSNVASSSHMYYVLSMTDVASGRSNWLPVLTNMCAADGSGCFSNNVPVSGNVQFFLIEVPTP